MRVGCLNGFDLLPRGILVPNKGLPGSRAGIDDGRVLLLFPEG